MPQVQSPSPFARPLLSWIPSVVAGAILGVGCQSPPPAESPPDFDPTATVQDLMLNLVDPSADAIWESVATVVTDEGVEDRRPTTDEDWAVVRRDAITLVEATNLLLMDRLVAKPGVASENPGIELEPEQIAELIENDPETWRKLVHGLHDVSEKMLQAVDARDADMLFDNGGPLDDACEQCHRHYWYPETAPTAETTAVAEKAAAVFDSHSDLSGGGTIAGLIRLDGKSPGNPVIRMGRDPKCADMYAGTSAVQEAVLTGADHGLANVFVRLDGSFPPTPVPTSPVRIDQHGCIFVPRVVGARVGQTLEVTNSDPLLHNVHALSGGANGFNISQPMQGESNPVVLGPEQDMLRLQCDVHSWMTGYVGVVDHPYFAVSDGDGGFRIEHVPPGKYTLHAWHEVFGEVTREVQVDEGGVTDLDLSFAADAG